MEHKPAHQLATEKMQSDFTFFNDLTLLLGKLRKTNMTPADIKKSGIKELTQQHTGILINFGVPNQGSINAYMIPPALDVNHPFFQARGFRMSPSGKDRKAVFGKGSRAEAWVNDAEYKVGGTWSNIPVVLCILKGAMTHTAMTDKNLAALFLHELGHVYTYFSLFGRLATKNFLTMEAIKELTAQQPIEKRIQALELLEGDLNINIKNKEDIAHQTGKKGSDMVEAVVITETVLTASSTNSYNYETRVSEQIADQFAIYHGAGAALAEALTTMYKVFRLPETYSSGGFVIFEILKVFAILYMGFAMPIIAILLLILCIPGDKIYDDPQARITIARKQLVQSLKDTKGQPELHKAIMEQIDAIDRISGVLKDRRTLYQFIYQSITPRGRTMYKQEVYMKAIENLLFNDTYLNAAKFGELANEL